MNPKVDVFLSEAKMVEKYIAQMLLAKGLNACTCGLSKKMLT